MKWRTQLDPRIDGAGGGGGWKERWVTLHREGDPSPQLRGACTVPQRAAAALSYRHSRGSKRTLGLVALGCDGSARWAFRSS
jgi:hypothetical protein|eukprot:SAG25_NODE_1682_length_2560_cov_3.149533_5_plen_82_part_00